MASCGSLCIDYEILTRSVKNTTSFILLIGKINMDVLLFEMPTESTNETTEFEPLLDNFANIMEWEVVLHPANCLLTIKGIGVKALDIVKSFKQRGISVTQVFVE